MHVTDSRIGVSLRNARENKGKTLAEIAQVTRIRPDHLEAIERGDFTSLPPIYVRLHIRTYAEEVGLDPAPLLADYEKGFPAVDRLPDAAPKYQPIQARPIIRGVWIRWVAGSVAVVAVAVSLAALIGRLLGGPTPQRPVSPPPLFPLADTVAVVLLPQQPDSLPIAADREAPELPQVAPDSLPAVADSAAGDAQETAPDSLPPPGDDERSYAPSAVDSGNGTPDVGYSSPPGGIVVSVNARNRVWMQVYTVEDILYYGILQPGEQRTWRDPVGIELKVRNWRDVVLTVGGELVPGVSPDAEEVKLCVTASGIDVLHGREWRLHRGPFEPPMSSEER